MQYRKWPKVRKAQFHWEQVIYWCEEIQEWRERSEGGANIYS